MVRPAVRFRPAARRALGGDLVPVFFVEQNIYGVNNTDQENTLVDVISGTEDGGVVASYNVLNDAPRTLAPTASKGLLTVLKDAIIAEAFEGETFFEESEIIKEITEVRTVAHQVIDNTAYSFYLRSHVVEHTAYVRYQFFTSINPEGIGPILTQTKTHELDYIIDVAIFKVDLNTGALTTSVHPVEEFSAVPKDTGNDYVILGDGARSLYPPSFAIHAALPGDHPFKSCGSALWSRNNTSEVPSSQSYTDSLLSDIEFPGGLFLSRYDESQFVSMYDLLGLNTNSGRRLVRRALTAFGLDRVYELSSYQPGNGGTCAMYRDIAEIWTDSYSEYQPGNVLDREDAFADLDGLSTADQELFLSTTYVPPAFIAPGTSTAGTTSDPTYFMETSSETPGLGYPDDVVRSVSTRYWIPD